MAKMDAKPMVRPLFAQIEELITARIVAGEWKPGEPLPSESEFAAHYNVSQGTVRKAISQMTADHLVVRFRGKGTFVANQTTEREHSHFFQMFSDDGVKGLPQNTPITCQRRKATRQMADRLALENGSEVIVMERLRLLDKTTKGYETIVVAGAMFPGLCDSGETPLPNELYPYYEAHYGVRVVTAQERIKAVAASPAQAETLGIEPATPLLEIDRIAMTFREVPVEWRRSLYLTTDHHYLSTLR